MLCRCGCVVVDGRGQIKAEGTFLYYIIICDPKNLMAISNHGGIWSRIGGPVTSMKWWPSVTTSYGSHCLQNSVCAFKKKITQYVNKLQKQMARYLITKKILLCFQLQIFHEWKNGIHKKRLFIDIKPCRSYTLYIIKYLALV